MRKLGFDGRLGKDGQGIAQPIATKVRCSSVSFMCDRNVPKDWVWEPMALRRRRV